MLFINKLLNLSQTIFHKIYEKSFVLKNIDSLIFASIIAIIFSFGFASSDFISYFAISSILLTVLKLLVKKGEKVELNTADKFLLLYFIFIVISVCGSSLLYLSIKGFMKTLIYISFYVSLIHFFKDNLSKIKYIFLAFAILISYETVIAFLQNFAAVSEISGWQDTSRLNPEEVMTRVYGTIQPLNPNLFGGFLVAAIPAFISTAFINRKFAFLSMVISTTSILALIFTGCRGAYIASFIQILTLICITYKFLKPIYKRAFSAIVGFCSIILTMLILSVSNLRARVFSIFAMRSDSSNSFRFNVYNSCIDMFKDNWLLGIGVGNQNFREIYGLYMKTGFDALSAYNIYLETAVESGIFALLSFIGYLIVNITKALKYIFNSNKQNVIYVISALISIIGILIHGFVDTVFFRPQIQFTFWIMISIIRVITSLGDNYDSETH